MAPLELRDPGRVSMYVCGPTVYDEPHLGHGRFNVAWDVLRRYLTWSGLDVRFVSNVTDIDDKIIARAALEGRSTEEVAAEYEQVWWDTMARLGVERPTDTPHATAYVQDMADLIADLITTGHAYVGGDGVYFAAESIDGYGLLAHQPLDSLRVGARVEVDEEAGKRSPIDFALWKDAKEGEPSWDSPWGPGRPGWHTECVVMALDLLGDGLRPARRRPGSGLPPPRERAGPGGRRRPALRPALGSFGHGRHRGGEKMSKSLGNTLSLLGLLDAYDPRAFRLQVLQSHYRSPMTVTEATMAAAAAAVEGLDAFAREFAGARGAAARSRRRSSASGRRMDNDLRDARRRGRRLRPHARRSRRQSERPGRHWRPRSSPSSRTPSVCRCTARSRNCPRRPWPRPGPGTRPGPRGTGPPPTACAPSLQAEGWIVEDGPDGTTIRR